MNISNFRGYLRTRRGCVTIYWKFHPSAGVLGWMYVDLGGMPMLTKIGVN